MSQAQPPANPDTNPETNVAPTAARNTEAAPSVPESLGVDLTATALTGGGTNSGVTPVPVRRRRGSAAISLAARGEPMVWATGAALAIALLMIIGLLFLIVVQGAATFWPKPLVLMETKPVVQVDVNLASPLFPMPMVTAIKTLPQTDFLGEAMRAEQRPLPRQIVVDDRSVTIFRFLGQTMEENGSRQYLRTGNHDLTGTDFEWVPEYGIKQTSKPEWAMVLTRRKDGNFYGMPLALLRDGEAVADEPHAIWEQFQSTHHDVRDRLARMERLEGTLRELGHQRRFGERRLRKALLNHGQDSALYQRERERFELLESQLQERSDKVNQQIQELHQANDRFALRLRAAGGREAVIPLANIDEALCPNRLSFLQKLQVYLYRWWTFLTENPYDANAGGGVFPAIFGTVTMTLIMTLAVVPFGVITAVYLREYAKAGIMISMVRIAVNNLAGVPSIVYGVFGLAFFCYFVGGSIDQLFFAADLQQHGGPGPTFGKEGLMWAGFTLALLTVPVVIVATEEALAAVPRSMREGSYACGASKWQTIRHIVLPRAMPGIMTGVVLAVARGAGEVAPLMLVGAVKFVKELPVDGLFPFLHPERGFMHLGFHVYDLAYQSRNSEAARSLVFTTTLLLIVIVAVLNLSAIWLRGRLRRRFVGGQF